MTLQEIDVLWSIYFQKPPEMRAEIGKSPCGRLCTLDDFSCCKCIATQLVDGVFRGSIKATKPYKECISNL